MKLTPWLVLLTLSLAACSGSKSAQKVTEETPQIELSDADEFTDTSTEEQPATETAEAPAEPTSDDVALSNTEPLVQESSLENTSPVVTEPGTLKQYTVQKNETLMMIAFKLYGDYARWKELANENASTLKGGTVVRTGMVLNYSAPAEEFVWNPQGNPYLIKTGDTLGTISKDVYATVKKWKLLWENNKPLIKDPNKIYAGFTIYYLENGREVAAEF
jgi:nucleoid-associated protein YgaU